MVLDTGSIVGPLQAWHGAGSSGEPSTGFGCACNPPLVAQYAA